MKKNMKKIILILIIIVILIISLYILIMKGIEKKEDERALQLKEDLNAEFLDSVKVSDFIENLEGTLIDDYYIETNTLGEKEVSFKYYNKRNKTKTKSFKINVIDTIMPEIFMSDSISVAKGYNKDLTDMIFSGDICDANPTRKIEGDYDLNQIGSYNLKFVITDASGNENSKDFTLNVVNTIRPTQNIQKKLDFSEALSKYKTEETELGIDVSKWQGEINWEEVKKSGAKFAFIRVGSQNGFDGENIEDECFKANIEGAKKQGLKVGIYYYTYAKTMSEIENQVDWITNKIKNYTIDLPIAFDWESWNSFNKCNLSFYDLNRMAQTYIKIFKNRGYNSLLYSSKYYLERIWFAKEYDDIWLANYTDKTDYQGLYKYWQCSNTGKISGINGDVDIDIFYKNVR